MLRIRAGQTAAGAGAIPTGHSLAAAGSGAERSIRAIPARQAAAHRRGGCAKGYRCGHSASEELCCSGQSVCPIHAGKALFAGAGDAGRPCGSSALFRTVSGTGQHLRAVFYRPSGGLLRCGGGNRYPSDAPSDEPHIPRKRRPACHLCRNADRQEASPQIAGEAHGDGTQGG